MPFQGVICLEKFKLFKFKMADLKPLITLIYLISGKLLDNYTIAVKHNARLQGPISITRARDYGGLVIQLEFSLI